MEIFSRSIHMSQDSLVLERECWTNLDANCGTRLVEAAQSLNCLVVLSSEAFAQHGQTMGDLKSLSRIIAHHTFTHSVLRARMLRERLAAVFLNDTIPGRNETRRHARVGYRTRR